MGVLRLCMYHFGTTLSMTLVSDSVRNKHPYTEHNHWIQTRAHNLPLVVEERIVVRPQNTKWVLSQDVPICNAGGCSSLKNNSTNRICTYWEDLDANVYALSPECHWLSWTCQDVLSGIAVSPPQIPPETLSTWVLKISSLNFIYPDEIVTEKKAM